MSLNHSDFVGLGIVLIVMLHVLGRGDDSSPYITNAPKWHFGQARFTAIDALSIKIPANWVGGLHESENRAL